MHDFKEIFLGDVAFIWLSYVIKKTLVISQSYRWMVNNFIMFTTGDLHFCAQLFLHFSRAFEQAFTAALSSCTLVHIVGVLQLKHFWWNYGPFVSLKYRKIQYTFVYNSYKGFWLDFHRNIVIKYHGTLNMCPVSWLITTTTCFPYMYLTKTNCVLEPCPHRCRASLS